MKNTSHPTEFDRWKAQLDDLSLLETGDRNKYYSDIRDELYREMDRAESTFLCSSWIPGTIWPPPMTRSTTVSAMATTVANGTLLDGSTGCCFRT